MKQTKNKKQPIQKISTSVNPSIFREYDIRGVADRDLTGEAVEAIGKAYGTYLKRKKKSTISIGRDARVSSPRIHKALLKGILSTGLDVVDIGFATTPCLYYSIYHLKLDGGIMITGSHNPPDQNGLKMCIGQASLFGSQIQELLKIIEKGDFEKGKGAIQEKTQVDEYSNFIYKIFQFKKKLKVVVDCGNGMTAMIAPQLFKKFGHNVTELFTEIDGKFPNHPADPSDPENMHDVVKAVKRTGADVGIGFDGDGDRCGIVDEKGNFIYGDKLLIIFARSILKDNPGATIIGDVKCSSLLFKDIAQHGGRPIMWKTGHSLMKAKMKEEKALLGGEVSGHMFFQHRWLGFDSGVYAACRVLEILEQEKKPLSELLADLPKTFATPEIRVECPDDKKFDVVRKAVEYFKKQYKVADIDGARIEFSDGWGLVRASNTQPVLVMRFEAVSEKRLAEIKKLVETKVNEISRT